MEKIPCDPEFRGTERCELFRKIGKCFMDVHHLYHPRRDYKKEVAREFRNLDENKRFMCRNLHNLEHAIFEPPEKPDTKTMRQAIADEKEKRISSQFSETSEDGEHA